MFGWDARETDRADRSYLHHLTPALRARSRVEPGTPDGPFRVLYVLDRESLAELQNATVHAFLSAALVPTPGGYRLYWAVYVKPVSWLTPFYMALIEPFRRWIVYPSIFRRLAKAWRNTAWD